MPDTARKKNVSEETKLEAFIAVDFYSGYLFYEQIRKKDGPTVIKIVRRIFQHFGLAEKVITDNGPAFKSTEFNTFLQNLEIRRIPSSPHFHQSNGRAERAVQTIKQILKKCELGRATDEVLAAITAYHDTPIDDNLPTPAELFLNRRINTRLTMSLLPTTLKDEEKQELHRRRAHHLKPQTREDRTFLPDEPIWYTEDHSKTWRPGFIDANDIHPRSYWLINENNNKVRRNIADIKPRYAKPVTGDHRDTQHRNSTSKTVATGDHLEKHPDTPLPHVAMSETANANTTSSGLSPDNPAPITIAPEGNTGTHAASHDHEPHAAGPPAHRRTTRAAKPKRDSDFVYY